MQFQLLVQTLTHVRMQICRGTFVRVITGVTVLSMGLSGHLTGQDTAGHSAGQPPVPSPVLVVRAGFVIPHTQLEWSAWPWLRVCQAEFESAMLTHPDVRVPVNLDGTAVTGPAPVAATDESSSAESLDVARTNGQYPLDVITASQQCLGRVGNLNALPSYEWPFLLRFAVALNADSLAQTVVAKQLAVAGASSHDRADILANAITLLAHNDWEVVGAKEDHRTLAHDALLRRYVADLDTLHPAGPVVTTRLNIADIVDGLYRGPWNVDTELVREQRRLTIVRSVPIVQVPKEDTALVQATVRESIYRLARLTYLKTPTHETLIKFRTTRDSMTGGPGESFDSLLARPAPRLEGDYWFNTPVAGRAPVVPASGVLSLLAFLNAREGDRQMTEHWIKRVREIHARFPTLQIVIVTMTQGQFRGVRYDTHPEQEAELLHHYLSTELQLPGIVCVLQTKYHTEPGATAVPLASPVLDRFHLDPREYDNHFLLIDAEGWAVQDGGFLQDDHLLSRMVGK